MKFEITQESMLLLVVMLLLIFLVNTTHSCIESSRRIDRLEQQ
jgi:hypothetical protein